MQNEKELHNQSIGNKNNIQSLLIVTTIGIIVAFAGYFQSGNPSYFLYYRIMHWISMFAFAIFIDKLCQKIKNQVPNKTIEYIPFLFFITPLIYSLDFAFEYEYRELYHFVAATINFSTYIFLGLYLYRQIDVKLTRSIVSEEKESKNETPTVNFSNKNQNSTILNNVISSIQNRAISYNKNISFSLIAMIIIVAIGGSASFGTVALNEANKIRELETERTKMLEITNSLKNIDPNNLESKARSITQLIKNRYGEQKSYEDILNNIEKQSYVSWPDIAMRITIAALTLFLVQIFFHIYKYNQQQAARLFAKVETLKLFDEEGADLNTLRNNLLAKLDGSPSFEKSPTSPTDQMIKVISSAKDKV